MSDQTEQTTTDGPKGQTYKFTLKGGGLSLDREVDEGTAFQILGVVMGGGATLSNARPAVGGPVADPLRGHPGAAGRLSLREHMDELEPKRNPDKILTIAAYLVDAGGADTFTSDDVKKEFKNASEPVPANYARDWRWAVSNGWIAKVDGEPGEFYITQKGRDALSKKFSDEVKKATKQAGRRRRTRKRAEDSK